TPYSPCVPYTTLFRSVFGADLNADHRFIRRIQVPLYSSAEASQPSAHVNTNRNTEDFNEKATLLNYQLLLEYDIKIDKHDIKAIDRKSTSLNSSHVSI